MRGLCTGVAIVCFSIAAAAAEADLRLVEAARKGDVEAARALIAQKVPLNAAEADGSTALHLAARYNHLQIAELLIAAGADINAVTRYNVTPLSLACSNGSTVLIERLLDNGADVNGVSREGQTALMTAALHGSVAATKLLIARGAAVNAVEPVKGQTALMWAAAEGNTGAVEALVDAGADLYAKSRSGFTPLLFAVRGAHQDTVRALLARGANPNDVAPDRTSALNMAVVNAYFEVAHALVEGGADPNAPDPRGSALHTLAWLRSPGDDGGNGLGRRSYGPPQPTGNLTSLELAKALLEHGANPNTTFSFQENVGREGTTRNPPLITMGRHIITYVGATPFYLAARGGDVEYMKLLVAHGADPKKPNVAGVTPLMVAAGMDTWEGETPGPYAGVPEAQRLEAVKLALELGNDINAVSHFGDYQIEGDSWYTLIYPALNQSELRPSGGDARWSGMTALHGSIVANQPSITQFLVDKGAKLDVKNISGWTPLMMASGVFLANAKREYLAAGEILKKAMVAQGLMTQADADAFKIPAPPPPIPEHLKELKDALTPAVQ